MGMGKINVFVTADGDPCHLTERPFWVALADCNGNVVNRCGKSLVKQTKCGHVEFGDIPPGCYILQGVHWTIRYSPTPPYFLVGNHLTHIGIASVCCEQTSCITLYSPSAHQCGRLFGDVIKLYSKMGVIKEGGEEAVKALRIVTDQLGKSSFDEKLTNYLLELEQQKTKEYQAEKTQKK